MPFDDTTRNELQKIVGKARDLLVEEFTAQCQRIYGIQPSGLTVDFAKLDHLPQEEQVRASLLRDRIDHLAAGITGVEARSEAVARMVREQGFTVLNRLCALRMCEERGLVQECVRSGYESKGFRLYDQTASRLGGDTYSRYALFLQLVFDELSVDLGVLFDRFALAGLLFPGENALKVVLGLINASKLSHIWSDDEAIGWVYQYFNSSEERKAMREAAAAPRNSQELAVRNQFFTPRYVVEFLTDNTLGRIWYEMRKGDTSLVEVCRYLVRRPNEIFLPPGEKSPDEQGDQPDLPQDELLKRSVYIEHRPKKDARDLRVLDPACGSGHFLLYAFDLLGSIYTEAWHDPECPKSEVTGHTLREDFETFDEFRQIIPKLIIEYNLHGIDIDPRAVQIAAMALWLRAQKAWKNLGLSAAERPRIDRTNIVSAEPMPGEDEMRREFTAGIKPPVLGQLVNAMFEKMKLAGEAGSLLRIDEDIKDAVAEARRQWLKGPKLEQAELFPALVRRKPEQQQLRFDLTGVTEQEFWEQAEDRILAELKGYAQRAENGHATRRRLFAEDAAHGFAFVDLCRKRFDAVLMNPPFGESSAKTQDYLGRCYPTWNVNLLCAFLQRGWEMSNPHGSVGAIYDRTAVVKSTYEEFRRSVLLPDDRLCAMADLGWEVLDANVEVTTSVLCHTPHLRVGIFVDCRPVSPDDKNSFAYNALRQLHRGDRAEGVFLAGSGSFRNLPNAVVGYDFPDFLRVAFNEARSLQEVGFKANQGHALKAEKHFRLWWERDTRRSAGFWARLFNGAGYSPYWTALRDCVIAPTALESLPKDTATVLRNTRLQQLPGLCFGKRGEYFCAHVLPAGHVFTVEGQSIPVSNFDQALELAALLNTPLVRLSLNKYCGQHKYSGYLNLLPFRPWTNADICRTLVAATVEAYRVSQCYDETEPLFARFFEGSSVLEYADRIISSVESARAASTKSEAYCHEESLRIYSVSQLERSNLEAFRSTQPLPQSPIEDADGRDSCKWLAAHGVVSHGVGVVFGRWDIRIALDPELAPEPCAPFEHLPSSPPATLVGSDGLPAKPGAIVSEEWLRARPDANTLPPEGAVTNPIAPDAGYPFRVSWDGILVDDPGFTGGQPHRDDIVRRVHEVFDLLWRDKAHSIEREACEVLGTSDLRDYFRKPSGFFQDHLKRYSKSRRKAPIYWPLSTESGNYTIWLYFPRLSEQTLYTCVNDYLDPKLKDIEADLGRLRISATPDRKTQRHLDELEELQTELKSMRERLLKVAALPYKPNQDDGVLITAAPLWELFRHGPWRAAVTKCWDELGEKKYEWAHLAYAIWPDRVREVSKKDKSIALIHGLTDLHKR